MKILIVEDETKTGNYLRQGLAEAGFVVDLARNDLDGLHLGSTDAHDLAMLDVSAATLAVENTGETIAPEQLSRLFDRFYCVHSSRQRFAEGAGLGLAITRSIVRAHGGEVTASSGDGITAFVLRIPARQGEP